MNKKKKELIKSSYGDYWMIVKDIVDDNGWCFYEDIHVGIESSNALMGVYDWLSKNDNLDSYLLGFRPKNLKGVSSNNGWTVVNNKSDMPKVDCLVKICFEGKVNSIVYHWYSGPKLLEATKESIRGFEPNGSYKFWIPTISHFKIYIADIPPLY